MIMLAQQPASKLYVYTINGVTLDAEELIARPQQLVYNQRELDLPSPASYAFPAQAEATLPLRPHQVKAAEDVMTQLEAEEEDVHDVIVDESSDADTAGRVSLASRRRKLMLLHMPCGTGKTLVAAHVLRRIAAARVVVAAPLRSLVDQLWLRLAPFLPDHTALLVDTDGTTNAERVRLSLAAHERTVVYTTYDSALGVPDNSTLTDEHRDMLVVDEAHNVYTNLRLRDWIQSFRRGLLMTATPQHDLVDELKAITAHSLSFRDAIEAKLLADYNAWFPLLVDMSTERELEVEIAGLPHEPALKALFLIRGMLHAGARLTFAYLSTQDEAREFAGVFKKVALLHHGMPA
jgi:hypothetical protein